jgi:phosphoenolpyruvate carboxykinase (ATP)
MPLHPTRYAEMLGERMERHDVRIWLVNTGWSGGGYGVGNRMKLSYTRAMIGAAMRGELDQIAQKTNDTFGLTFPISCPGVPANLMNPKDAWADGAAYDAAAAHLAGLFAKNFKKFESMASEAILDAAPVV